MTSPTRTPGGRQDLFQEAPTDTEARRLHINVTSNFRRARLSDSVLSVNELPSIQRTTESLPLLSSATSYSHAQNKMSEKIPPKAETEALPKYEPTAAAEDDSDPDIDELDGVEFQLSPEKLLTLCRCPRPILREHCRNTEASTTTTP